MAYNGEVEIIERSEPPKGYQYWHAHGVKYPRNKKTRLQFMDYFFVCSCSALFYLLGCLAALIVSALLKTFLGTFGPDVPLSVLLPFVLSGGTIGAAAAGGFIACFVLRQKKERVHSSAWVEDEKKTKDSTRGTKVHVVPPESLEHLKQ